MAKLPKLDTLKIKDGEIKEFLALLENRAGSSDLYRMADRFHAAVLLQSAIGIRSAYEMLMDGDDLQPDDLQKIVSSINRMATSFNQSLKSLGLDGKDRPDETSADPLADFLASVKIEKNCPPILEKEYIAAKKDLIASSGTSRVLASGTKKSDAIKEVTEPINYHPEEERSGKDGEVVDVDNEKVESL